MNVPPRAWLNPGSEARDLRLCFLYPFRATDFGLGLGRVGLKKVTSVDPGLNWHAPSSSSRFSSKPRRKQSTGFPHPEWQEIEVPVDSSGKPQSSHRSGSRARSLKGVSRVEVKTVSEASGGG